MCCRGNAVCFLVVCFFYHVACTYMWKCCYLYIPPSHFRGRGMTVQRCMDICALEDCFSAVGNITFERTATNIVKDFDCMCIPNVGQCVEMPSTYCFSRLDSSESWMPTGGPPLLYSIYAKCMPDFYGPDCDKPCLCKSLCAPLSGKCPQRDCGRSQADADGIQCKRDCTVVNEQCRSLCENNETIVECSCDKYEYYDHDSYQCKGFRACIIHNCSPVACRTDGRAEICDCTKESGTYETLVYGLPFCRKLAAPCQDHICDSVDSECHEDSKGKAVCFCEGGNLPDENGECINPITVMPTSTNCHGYFNQGFYVKCLCHDNFVVSAMNKCERDVLEPYKGNLPCQATPTLYSMFFCQCPPACDRLKLCFSMDECPLPSDCKKCQVTHNNLVLNHTFGGIIYVTEITNVFVILGPSEIEGEEGIIFSYKQRSNWVTLSGRIFNLTGDLVDTPSVNDYYQFRIQKDSLTFVTYPIYLARMPPLEYTYRFQDGFDKILDKGFNSYTLRIIPGTLRPSIVSWYCTRFLNPLYRAYINQFPCYKKEYMFYKRGGEQELIFEENKLLIDEGSTYSHYYVYVVPQYRFRYLPEIVKRVTVKLVTDKNHFSITCLENCGPSLNTLIELKLSVRADSDDLYAKYLYKWKLPPGEVQDAFLDRRSLTLSGKQIRQLEDGNVTFIVVVFNRVTRMSFHMRHEVLKVRLARKNCSISPAVGFGLVTRFTATCAAGFNVKIMSGLCGKRKDVTLLKFKGNTDRPIENLVFSIGDPHDYYHKCIYIIDSLLVDDVDSVKFKVVKNLTYVTNFQYLGNLRMDSLSTIIVIGNAIEFFNDNPATDELDVEYRVKCRELLLDLIMLNWNKLEDQLLEMETIKLIYLLLANPLEIDPIYVVKNMNLFEMIDASKLWTTDNFNLTEEEYSTSLLYLTESLSYILYSAYVRYNESHDVRSKRVLSYVLDNLAYLGNYYVNQVTKNKTKTIATSVFTLFLQKFDLRTNESMELSAGDANSKFLIKIPTTPVLKMLETEVTMKLVIFPFNPLALTTGSLFTPTVSVSLYAEGTYLPLKNLLTPVVIQVPTETSEWLTYSGRFGTENTVTFLSLPTTLFNNTLYKLKINVRFEQAAEELRRIDGVLILILCEGSSRELELRIQAKNYQQCHEIAFKRIKRAERTFNFTLPPMFMQHQQNGLIYSFMTSDKVEYTLTFSMIQLSCQYWYEPDERSSYGCAVSPIHTSDETLVCLCYHLSMFTGDTQVESQDVDITSLFGGAINESVSQLGLATIVSLWIFFIMFGIWAKKMDQKLAILAYPVDLADNYPNAEYVYLVAVETGIRPFAGCDGTVFIVLIGTLNKSLSHKLVCKRYITLQTGHQNYFIIRATEPLGKVTQVRLWIVDETQSNKKINWYVNLVTVFDLQFRDAYVFICDEWMGVNMKGVNNDMTFFAATSLMLNEFNNIFTMNFFKGFVENHVWFSIFTNPILSRFTRFQRVATCKLNTHLYLLTTLLFQKLQSPEARSGTIFYTIFKDVALTIIIGILMSPLFWFFDVLFSQSRKRKITHNIISDWNRNIGTKKKEDEPEEELALTRVVDVIVNFLSKIFKGPAGAEVQEDAEFDMYEENPNVGTAGLGFNQFQQMMDTGSDQMNFSNDKVRVSPTFQRNYNAKPKTPEDASTYKSTTKTRKQSKISHIESLESFESEYDKESAKTVHSVSDIAKGLLQEEIMGEKTKLLMKTLIEQRGGKLKKKMKKYHVETVEGHLPWWMNWVAWIFLTITICVTSFFIFVLIKQNVSEITADWFARVFITLLANIFIIDPICIVVGAFCRSLVSRQYINFPLGRLGVIKHEALQNLTHYYDYHKRRVYKLRKSPFYKSPIMIKKKIKVEKKMKLSKLLLLNIILFTYLIACAMIISMSIYDYSMFLAKYSINRLLVGKRVKEIRERDQYYLWLKEHLIPNIYGPDANQARLSKMFSRSLNFQLIPSVTAYAINYPCFTRISDQKSWEDYHNDPEWYIFETICMGYSRGLGDGCIEVMENNSFFNFNFVAMGTTFYIYIPAVQSIAWIFLAAHQPMGGGFRVVLEEVFLVSHSPIPFEQPRVAIALIMFWPAFAFSLFRNMKRFFYVGAGLYFSNFWNILDLAATFMVLMISIIYVFVIHGITKEFSEFYLSSGDLYVTFYISGVVGIMFLINLMTFIIVIRVIELLKLNHLQRIIQLCLAQSLKIFCLIVIKFGCVGMGLIYLKMCFFSEHKEEYAQINQRFVFFIYDMIHPRKLLAFDANYHMTSLIVLIIAIFSGTLRAFIVSDIVLTYRRLRRYQSRNKELRNLIEYLKTLMLDFVKWSSALLSGKRPVKKHHKKKGNLFYRQFVGRKDSSDIENRSMHGSFVRPIDL